MYLAQGHDLSEDRTPTSRSGVRCFTTRPLYLPFVKVIFIMVPSKFWVVNVYPQTKEFRIKTLKSQAQTSTHTDAVTYALSMLYNYIQLYVLSVPDNQMFSILKIDLGHVGYCIHVFI